LTKIIGIIVGIFVLLAIRQAFVNRVQDVVKTATTDQASTCLTMVGNTTSEIERSTYIVGSIRNNCDRKFMFVTIVFKLDLPSDAKFRLPDATAGAYLRDVKPRETREFKSSFRVPRNVAYHFDTITAF
jgi:hypothetical protein